MNWPEIKIMQASIRTEWPQVGALLALVFLSAGSVVGLLEFGTDSFPGVAVDLSPFTSNGVFIVPEVVFSLEFWVLIATGAVMAALVPLLSPIVASLLVAMLAVPTLYINLGMIYRAESIITMEYSLLFLAVLFGTNVLLKYFAEALKKQKLINDFGRFVPPEIVSQLSKQPNLLELQGESRQMTVFFCDLKNFTGFSEKLSPKDLVSLLNEYFTVMTEILYKHGATIDKYIGDSIMAFWNAPIPQEDHASRAVKAAMEMHKEIEILSQDFISRGWPGPTMGVGLNSGEMNVGNMGSKYRLAYTVIGDAVNLAARVEAMTRLYGVDTIVGEETAAAATDIVFRELDTVTVKGKTSSTRIFEPICALSELTDQKKDFLERHKTAMASYYDRDVETARALLIELLKESGDQHYYEYLLDKLTDRRAPRTGA